MPQSGVMAGTAVVGVLWLVMLVAVIYAYARVSVLEGRFDRFSRDALSVSARLEQAENGLEQAKNAQVASNRMLSAAGEALRSLVPMIGPDGLRAGSFEVVRDGRVVAKLGTQEDGAPLLALQGREGQTGVSLIGGKRPSLGLFGGSEGEWTSLLSAGRDLAGLSVCPASGPSVPRVLCAVVKGQGVVTGN